MKEVDDQQVWKRALTRRLAEKPSLTSPAQRALAHQNALLREDLDQTKNSVSRFDRKIERTRRRIPSAGRFKTPGQEAESLKTEHVNDHHKGSDFTLPSRRLDSSMLSSESNGISFSGIRQPKVVGAYSPQSDRSRYLEELSTQQSSVSRSRTNAIATKFTESDLYSQQGPDISLSSYSRSLRKSSFTSPRTRINDSALIHSHGRGHRHSEEKATQRSRWSSRSNYGRHTHLPISKQEETHRITSKKHTAQNQLLNDHLHGSFEGILGKGRRSSEANPNGLHTSDARSTPPDSVRTRNRGLMDSEAFLLENSVRETKPLDNYLAKISSSDSFRKRGPVREPAKRSQEQNRKSSDQIQLILQKLNEAKLHDSSDEEKADFKTTVRRQQESIDRCEESKYGSNREKSKESKELKLICDASFAADKDSADTPIISSSLKECELKIDQPASEKASFPEGFEETKKFHGSKDDADKEEFCRCHQPVIERIPSSPFTVDYDGPRISGSEDLCKAMPLGRDTQNTDHSSLEHCDFVEDAKCERVLPDERSLKTEGEGDSLDLLQRSLEERRSSIQLVEETEQKRDGENTETAENAEANLEERERLLQQIALLQAQQNDSLRTLLVLRLEQFWVRHQQMTTLMDIIQDFGQTMGVEEGVPNDIRNSLNRMSLEVLLTLQRLLQYAAVSMQQANNALTNGEQAVPAKKGAAQEVIDALKCFEVTTESEIYGQVCPICLNMYKSADRIRQLPCSHEFHQQCVDSWLKVSDTCPNCRVSITCDQQLEDLSAETERGEENNF